MTQPSPKPVVWLGDTLATLRACPQDVQDEVGYALYLRYLAVEFSTVALACDAGLQSMLCKSRTLATYLFKNSVFGIVALIIATLHVMRPSIATLTVGLIAAGFGIVLYNVVLSGIAIGLLILGFARPAPATA